VEFRILGPIELHGDGGPVPLRAGLERSLLALLLLDGGRLVTRERIIEALWDEPPASATAQVHNVVSRLRRAAGGELAPLLVSNGSGYRLELGEHGLDLAEFRRLSAEGRACAGEPQRAIALLTAALDCWRGPALADAVDTLAAAMRPGLEAERLRVAEALLDAELAAGRLDAVLDGVGRLLAEHPYREDLYRRQMLALSASGRRADALDAYRLARERLVADLGIEPGDALRELHRQLLGGLPTTRAPSPAAPPTAPTGGPRQLPAAEEMLSGRGELLAAVRASLGPGRLAPSVVVLTGPGGVGKSALAVHAAHLHADDFADGQLYADLHGAHETPADPHEIAGRFLRGLGVPAAEVAAGRDERAAQYRSVLAGRRLLVLLDDARDEAQVRPLLPGAAGCTVVVTSRRRLDALLPLAATYDVPTLDPASAIRLLYTAAGRTPGDAGTDDAGTDDARMDEAAGTDDARMDEAAGTDDARLDEAAGTDDVDDVDDGVAADVVRLCGHLPLAIRIAGARLAARPDWTLARLRERLLTCRARLDELVVGDLDVRASIALSYRSLPPELAVAFRRLGLPDAVSFPAWLPAVLAGEPPAAGQELLDRLLDHHRGQHAEVDQAGQPRFRLHDLVHEFARETALAEDPRPERERALRRALDCWLALAADADERVGHGSNPVPAVSTAGAPSPVARERPMDWFEAERDNLVSAVRTAVELGRSELASNLALRVKGFLIMRGYGQANEVVQRLLVDHLRGTDLAEHGERLTRHLRALFWACAEQDRNDELPAICAETAAVAKVLGDDAGQLDAQWESGQAAARLGRLEEAVEIHRACLAGALALRREGRFVHAAHIGLALTLAEIGDAEEAVAQYRAALAAAPATGRKEQIVLDSYAEVLVETGRLDEASRAIERAAAVTVELGDVIGAAHVGIGYAQLDAARGDLPAARARLCEALEVAREHRERHGMGRALLGLGEVLIGLGDASLARRHLDEALDVARQSSRPVDIARVQARLAVAWELEGDHGRADECRRHYRQILDGLDLTDACLRMPPHLHVRGHPWHQRYGPKR
jgi:DNA-binding SARP family transcriptional activator/Tfp pilus assembly protein PilF